MTHFVSTDVFTPGFESRPVKTEAATTLKDFTAEDVDFCLHLLAYNNTNYKRTSLQLEEVYGLSVHHITLKNWVSRLFPQKYVEIQTELDKQISEKLGTKTIDLAAAAMEAQERAIEHGLSTIEELRPSAVSTAVKNYADAASKNIQQAQLIRDRPTSIVKTQTPDDALKVLDELGLTVEAEEVE